MNLQKLSVLFLAATTVALETGPALAQATDGSLDRLPGPAIIGLVAIGVVGAMALSKWRR